MSESADVIMNGLESCIRVGGVPAIWQTDSTGSVKNKKIEFDPVVSLSARAGLTVVHPQTVGNSQANGIAENYNTRLDRESRALATYMHPERMDSLAFKQVRKFTGAMVKAAAKGDLDAHKVARAAALRVGKGLLFETKAQMVTWLDEIRVKSNNTPHSALRKITDDTGKVRHQSPQEALDAAIKGGWVPVALDEATLIELFRMHDRKTVRRGTVTHIKEQRYHHPMLSAYEGQEVIVASDTMDGERVWVKTTSGALICEALYVAATGYRALSTYEWALEKRMNAQIKRKENQIEDIKARMDPDRAPLEVRAIDVSEANAAHAQVYAFAPLPVQLPKRGAAPKELTFAERVYGAAVDAEEAAQAGAPAAVETYDQRMFRQLEEREAAQAAQALAQAQAVQTAPPAQIETFEERMLRLVDEQDARDESEKAARLAK
jgi:putative transposase